MDTTKTIAQQVVQIIMDTLLIDQNLISYKASFSDDLDVDSLDMCELLTIIEKKFKININEEDTDKIKTIGILIDYVENKTGHRIIHQQAEVIEIYKQKEDDVHIA